MLRGALVVFLMGVSGVLAADNILENGTFDNPQDPFKGWNIDYEWTGNGVYMGNKNCVSITPRDGLKKNVLTIIPRAEAKVESKLIPYEQGARYRCTMDIRDNKRAPGGTRVYFAGYRWAPGIRPHDNPELHEMRMVYKSKAETIAFTSWKNITLDFPMENLSSTAKKHLRYVRYFTIYIWTAAPVSVDNVTLIKMP